MKVFLVCVALLTGLFVNTQAHAQADQFMEPLGGSGGGAFVARCLVGDILTGFELKTGDDVDSIRPICARPTSIKSIAHTYAFSRRFGGDGGGKTFQIVCPPAIPAIAGITVDYEGEKTIVVHSIGLYCSEVVPNQQIGTTPTIRYRGPEGGGSDLLVTFKYSDARQQTCPPGLLPVGISGRSGIWLDAFGLICGASPINTAPPVAVAPPSPIKAIGRVDTGPSAPRPQRSICDNAVDARARNSPAAANLEAQCQAAGGIYKMRPSDADFELVRARGEARAAKDPSAGNIRSVLFEAPRRGFDIGLGIWDNQTAPGPGKQRYRDFLSFAEQQGFDMAAAYALPRNKYAGLVDVGTVINAADAQVRAKRNASKDGFYWLGFDIASGLFGDPRAGSQGSKVIGTGAIAIRDSLNAAGQAGFNASMQLHFARKYQ